jgi:hypothetical protein
MPREPDSATAWPSQSLRVMRVNQGAAGAWCSHDRNRMHDLLRHRFRPRCLRRCAGHDRAGSPRSRMIGLWGHRQRAGRARIRLEHHRRLNELMQPAASALNTDNLISRSVTCHTMHLQERHIERIEHPIGALPHVRRWRRGHCGSFRVRSALFHEAPGSQAQRVVIDHRFVREVTCVQREGCVLRNSGAHPRGRYCC